MSSLPDSPSAERPLPAEPPAVTGPPMPAHACGTGFALQKKWESRRKRSGALQGAGGGVLGACPPLPGAHEGLPRPLGGRGHSDKAAETGLSAAPPSRSQGPRPRGAGTALALPRVLSTRETARCSRRGGKQKGAGSIPLAPRLHRVYMPPFPRPPLSAFRSGQPSTDSPPCSLSSFCRGVRRGPDTGGRCQAALQQRRSLVWGLQLPAGARRPPGTRDPQHALSPHLRPAASNDSQRRFLGP